MPTTRRPSYNTPPRPQLPPGTRRPSRVSWDDHHDSWPITTNTNRPGRSAPRPHYADPPSPRPPGPSSTRRPGRPPRPPRPPPQPWSVAKDRFQKIGRGYSRFQHIYGSVAFLSSLLFMAARLHGTLTNFTGSLREIADDCAHADFVVEQLDAMLCDKGLARALTKERAGERLAGNLRKGRREIRATSRRLRDRLDVYLRDQDPSLVTKAEYFVKDAKRISQLRGQLRGQIDAVEEMMVWLNRPRQASRSRSRDRRKECQNDTE